MLIHNPTFLVNLVMAIWMVVFTSFWVIHWPGLLLKSKQPRSWISLAVSGFVRMLTLMILGSLIWIILGLFNWFTAFLTVVASSMMLWSFGAQRRPRQQLRVLGTQVAAATIDLLDRGLTPQIVQKWVTSQERRLSQFIRHYVNRPTVVMAILAMLLIAVFAVNLRFSHPLQELRFSQPDSYSRLLTVQQILGRERLALENLPIFPVLIALMSLLSGVDAIHTQHFGSALLGCWLVMAVGYGIWHLTRSLAASAIAMLGLGAYLFTWSGEIPPILPERLQQWLNMLIVGLNQGLIRQWNPNEVEMGSLFLILGITSATQILQPSRQLDGWIDTLCCLLMVLLTMPALVLPLLVGSGGIIFAPTVALFAVSMSWLFLALWAAIPASQIPLDPRLLTTLPVVLSLLVGMVFWMVTQSLKGLLSLWSESICMIVFLALAVNFWLPSPPLIDYLEYDAAARKTVEIGNFFPYKAWTLIAPIEQLPQSYHQGWYDDLAKFIETHQEQMAAPSFHLPYKTPFVFILVEKKPFGLDRAEPLVPYSTLHDPVYRSYRSATGRSKLQAKAVELCRAYAHNHPDSKIYYEDAVIQIYQFVGQPAPPIS